MTMTVPAKVQPKAYEFTLKYDTGQGTNPVVAATGQTFNITVVQQDAIANLSPDKTKVDLKGGESASIILTGQNLEGATVTAEPSTWLVPLSEPNNKPKELTVTLKAPQDFGTGANTAAVPVKLLVKNTSDAKPTEVTITVNPKTP
jgi:hypothetical protein